MTHDSRITAVLIPMHDHDEYMRLKRLATHAIRVAEVSDDAARAVAETQMDARHDHLNALMDDRAWGGDLGA